MPEVVDGTADTLAGATESAEAASRTLAEVRPRAAPSKGVIGKQFAHFRVERDIGRGGMGEVYLANDLALDRPVAVKLLPRDVAKDEQFRARFIREARAQARIMHPHICHIYFIGEQDEQLFFAMEFVEGENLAQRLDRAGKMAVPEAIDIVTQAARGLREAERHGFIHRDIKPSNLLVDKNGVVKLVDFGLVKSAKGAEAETAGTIVGTPLYIAPEQARGEAVDFRADIYGLGVTLHHLVSGKPPFEGTTANELVSKHMSDPRPPVVPTRRGTLLDHLLDRMMAKRPEDRFASYDELLDALDELAPDRTRPAGLTARGLAFCIDFFLVAAASALVGAGLKWLGGQPEHLLAVFAALYAVILPARTGRTFGKMALDLRVRSSGRARRLGWGRALKRFAIQWGPSYILFYTSFFLERYMSEGIARQASGGIVAGLGALLPFIVGAIAIRSEGKRTLWDRWSGTRVVYA